MRRLVMKAILVLLLVSLLLPVSNPAYALERNGTGYTVTDSREYPIIFIPGMAGSTLDTQDGINVWPGSLSVSDAAFKALALKDDGRNPLPPDGKRLLPTGTVRTGLGDVYPVAGPIAKVAVGVIPVVGPVIGSFMPISGDYRIPAAWIYKGFYDYMETAGYKFDQTPSVLNQNQSRTGKVFFDFPYDFRQDNTLWTKALDEKVEMVRSQTKADKVILVGHSMGGLQARLYMKDPNRARKVAAVVFMGTPHHGAPMAFYSFTEGYNFGNVKLSDARMWEIAGNWEGGYQLTPDYAFIVDEKLEKLLGGVAEINTQEWISAQEYERHLQAYEVGKPYDIHYGLPNSDFATKSIAFHKKLGDSLDKYPWVKYYGIRGTGQLTTALLVARFYDVGLPEPVLRFEKFGSTEGDGTVPLKGAHIDGLDKDKEFEVKEMHGAIPSNAEAQKILTDIRKEVNNEDFRNDMVKKMTSFAKTNINTARMEPVIRRVAAPFLGVAVQIVVWFLRPDMNKIKLRDEIRDMSLKMLQNARANITIATGVEKDESGKDRPEHLYIDIVDFEVKDVGTGTISDANLDVTVDSLATFEQAISSTSNLADAYNSGKITVIGKGVVNGLSAKIANWIRWYVVKLSQ